MEPVAPCVVDEPCCPDGTEAAAPCHCLYADFVSSFSQYECLGEAAVCALLKAAECHVRGFFDECLRNQALLYMAAHIAVVTNVQATESSSRLAALSKGVLSRPGGSNPGDTAWLSLSVWGLAYQGMVAANPAITVLVA